MPAATPKKIPASPEVIEVLRDRAGPNKPEVLAAAEAARVKAAAESATKEATAVRTTEAKLEALALARLVPEDIRKLLDHRGHALLIGVSGYTSGWDQLPSVKNDLQDLKAGLAQHCETLEIEPSPTVAKLRDRMREFLLDRWNRLGERLFIYYSGHGFTDFNQESQENDGYITGSDTPFYFLNPGGAVANAVPFTEIDSWSRQTKAKHVLIVFDSTFSGTLFQTKGSPAELSQHDFDGVRRMLSKPVRYYITAGRKDEQVAAHGTFAKLLLRGLSGEADLFHQGIISAEELGSYLYHEVPGYSTLPQTPQFASIGNIFLSEGQFFFLTGPTAAGPSAPLATAPIETTAGGTMANRPGTSNNKGRTK